MTTKKNATYFARTAVDELIELELSFYQPQANLTEVN
jgi:hypothetical protein